MHMYILCGQQKRAVWGLTTEKSPVSVIYCLLVEFKSQERGLLCKAIRSGKEMSNYFFINWTKEGFRKIVLHFKPHLVYMHCSYAMLTNAECQHVTACSADLQYCYRYSALSTQGMCSVKL